MPSFLRSRATAHKRHNARTEVMTGVTNPHKNPVGRQTPFLSEKVEMPKKKRVFRKKKTD